MYINQGYHSFKKFTKKESIYNINCCHFGKRIVIIGPKEVVVKFIIPKGTVYYENSSGKIVSENIICTGKYY